MNREMPWFCAVDQNLTDVPDELLKTCHGMLDAVVLCINLSKIPDSRICDQLGIDKGHWSRILRGRASMPLNKLVPLMQLCGNRAPLQYLAKEMGMQLYEDAKAKRKAELEAELKALAA